MLAVLSASQLLLAALGFAAEAATDALTSLAVFISVADTEEHSPLLSPCKEPAVQTPVKTPESY